MSFFNFVRKFIVFLSLLSINSCLGSRSIVSLEEKSFGVADGKLVYNGENVFLLVSNSGKLELNKLLISDIISKSENIFNKVIVGDWVAGFLEVNQLFFITAGFLDRNLRMYKSDVKYGTVKQYATIENNPDELLIDPALVKISNHFLLSVTRIKGEVNSRIAKKSAIILSSFILLMILLTGIKFLKYMLRIKILKIQNYTIIRLLKKYIYCMKLKIVTEDLQKFM